jgi:hypothetical protein
MPDTADISAFTDEANTGIDVGVLDQPAQMRFVKRIEPVQFRRQLKRELFVRTAITLDALDGLSLREPAARHQTGQGEAGKGRQNQRREGDSHEGRMTISEG